MTRRRVLRGAGVGVLGIAAVGTLVGCGDDSGDPATTDPGGGADDATAGTRSAEPTEPAETGVPEGGAPESEMPESTPPESEVPADPPAESLAVLGDIPVGAAISATATDGSEVILARPSEAEVVGFSAICTHQGCVVEPGEDGIGCPCHGSMFDTLTGENVSGPAPSPLEPFAVQVDGEAILEG